MSGKIIGTIVGAAAAYFTGGIALVGFGAAIGGALGSLLDPKEIIEGPRLEDLKVQVSTFGIGVPRLNGTERFGGNVVWSTDKLEIATDTEAGKGGGPINRSYKYYVHMSLLLCETPRDGSTVNIVKIFKDGKLIWDASTGTSIETALASAENPYSQFVLFQGHNDQLPDSIEESWTGGPGTCSAYRGIVRIRMIAIECPGGRVPQFSFVLSNSTVMTPPKTRLMTQFSDSTSTDLSYYAIGAGTQTAVAFPQAGTAQIVFDSTSTYGIFWSNAGFNVRPTQALTVEFYFEMVGGAIGPSSLSLMTLNAASGQTYKFYLNGAGVSGGGISFLSSNISYIEPGTNGTTGRHHCAVVFNGLGGHSVYIDGRRVGESTGAGNDPFATTTLLLGGNAGNGQSTTINYYGVRVIQAALYSGPLISPPAYFVVDGPTYSTLPVKVSGIIAAECVLAGVTTYDVSGIPDSDTVIGYKIANPASARANIEPLLTLIGGYVVDEDGATKFKKFSDITSVATVSFDELGQAEGDASGEAMPLTRTQEIDLPRSVTTSYIEPTNDYQTAAETEVRQVTAATEDVQLSLAVCITSSQAKKVSQMSLYDRWRRQNTRSTSVSRKFAAVSPGDGVTIEYPRGTFKLWLVLSTNDTGAVCEWSLCPGDAAIFTQTAIGATGYTQQAVIPAPSRSQMQIVDTSILQDADNDAGTYVALASYSGTYPGGALYVGNDTTSLDLRGTVQKQCVMGWCETALPAPSVGNTVDETSLVTVNVANFTLSSTTRDVMLNNASGVNVAAIGAAGRWEIVKFYKASSLGGGRYILSGLMRGQRGTEWAMGTHQVNDTFVFLSLAGLLHPSMGVGDIGLNKVYEAVTEGLPPTSATVQTYATTGEGLKPFSPVNARWSVDASNNVTITWDRRTRLSENWLLGLVPLGETSEAYSIGFYTSSGFVTLAGTLTSTTNAVTISSAQQTVFGLTPGAKPFVRISQVSSSIGRGRELQSAF